MSEYDEELRRRKYPRVKESCQVKYRVVEKGTGGPKDRDGAAVNISGGGMCFSSDEPLEPGSMVALEMSLSHLPTPVVSLGRVVWCEEAEELGKYDVGVEFWWIGWADEEAQRKMLQYVQERLGQMDLEKGGEKS